MIKVMILISEGACMRACSVLSDSLLHHGLWLTRLLSPWDSPGKILEWVVMSSSRGSSPPRDQTHVSCSSSWQADSLASEPIRKPTKNFSSVQFSCSVMSDSLRPHGLQHARPPCPSPTLEFSQTHVHQVSDAIQPSHPLLSPSPPAPNPSQHQGLFQ